MFGEEVWIESAHSFLEIRDRESGIRKCNKSITKDGKVQIRISNRKSAIRNSLSAAQTIGQQKAGEHPSPIFQIKNQQSAIKNSFSIGQQKAEDRISIPGF
jgi:hypothetical protein